MPHFGLIDENLPELTKFLLRARLHVRGGKIRLERKRINDGIAALYDALIYALYWFFLKDDELEPLLYDTYGKYKDELDLYKILIALGKVDREFNIKSFIKLSESALNKEVKYFDQVQILLNYDHLMEQLGILPFDEELLPKGVPTTL